MAKSRQERFHEPFFLQWHLTDCCNLECQHCYRGQRKEDLDAEELNGILEDYVRFLKQLGRGGRIQFTGGEPFLSPHLYELIERATARKISARVLSNGTAITPKAVESLTRAGCRLVQVSLDGLEDTHDALRGRGAFKRAVAGIAVLRAAGVEVTISMTVSRINLHQVAEVARLAQRIADRVSFHRLVPAGQATELSCELLLPEEVRQMMKELIDFRKDCSIDFPLRDPLWKAHFNPRLRSCDCVAGCAAGYNGLTIDSNGDVYPCRRLPCVLGNVGEDSLWDIWHAPLMELLRDRDRLAGKCGTCRLRWVCGGCRGVAFAVTGDALSEDPQCFREPSWMERQIHSITGWSRNTRPSGGILG